MLYLIFGCYTATAISCVIGTSARTGVVTLGALLLFGIKGIFRKAAVIVAAIGVFYVMQPHLNGRSMSRFSTIGTYQQDDSATIRLAVWQWAARYAAEHPFGGGFGIFATSSFTYQVKDIDGQMVTRQTRGGTAPHSVYFEVLGEHGYPGIFLYLAMIIGGLWGTWRISRMISKEPEHAWVAPFGRVLLVCIMLYCVGASFVGIAFQPLVYVFLGFYCSLYRWVRSRHVTRPKFSAKPRVYEAAA